MTEDMKKFEQTNIQKNVGVASNQDDVIQKSCFEEFIAGYATPEHIVQQLQESCKKKKISDHF
jgi:hypothetical protein